MKTAAAGVAQYSGKCLDLQQSADHQCPRDPSVHRLGPDGHGSQRGLLVARACVGEIRTTDLRAAFHLARFPALPGTRMRTGS